MNRRISIILLIILFGVSSGVVIGVGLKNPFSWVFSKVKSCGAIPLLAAKAAKGKASYETKMAFLKVADKLEVLDPRLIELVIAQEAAQAALATAQQVLRATQASLNAAEKSAEIASKLSQVVGKTAGKAFNVKKASFEGYATSFRNSPVVKLSFEAIVAGRPISLPEIEFNLMVPTESIYTMITQIVRKL